MKIRTKKYDVFFVDDDAGIRELISEELERLGCRFRSFARAADCLEVIAKENCDLLVTDVKMPGMDGLSLLNRVKQAAPWVPVIVITGFGDIPMSVRAVKSGAVDFIEKPLDRKVFLHKVRTALEQSNFVDIPVHKGLTKSERKVLNLLLQGKANKEIAYILGRTVRTIERHRSKVMHKFNVDNVVDLVKKAGLMNLDDEGQINS